MLASFATTWLTQHHQDERRRCERMVVEFIDLSSKAFVDALLQTSIEDPAKLVPLYAAAGKSRLFASKRTIEAADKVVSRIIETHCTPSLRWTRDSIFFASLPNDVARSCVDPAIETFRQSENWN
jgi:hypothetical protein